MHPQAGAHLFILPALFSPYRGPRSCPLLLAQTLFLYALHSLSRASTSSLMDGPPSLPVPVADSSSAKRHSSSADSSRAHFSILCSSGSCLPESLGKSPVALHSRCLVGKNSSLTAFRSKSPPVHLLGLQRPSLNIPYHMRLLSPPLSFSPPSLSLSLSLHLSALPRFSRTPI